jgi:hypothetical protein
MVVEMRMINLVTATEIILIIILLIATTEAIT